MAPLTPSVSTRLLVQLLLASLSLLLFICGCRIDEGLTNPRTADDPLLKDTRGIVFISYDRSSGTEGGEVYIINPDGTNLRCLTKDTDTVSFVSAAWSPDMARLAAVWVPGGRQGDPLYKSTGPADKKQRCLGLVDSRGHIMTRLQEFAAEPAPPVWSPDGSQIALTSRDAAASAQTFVYNAAGGHPQQITHFNLATGSYVSPVVYGWEVNGELSTCVRHYAGGALWFEFWKMDLAGTLVRRVFEERENYLLTPDSHGSLTICSYSRPGGYTGLVAFNGKDSTARPLRNELLQTEYSESYGAPKLSPDGRQMCFTINSPTRAQIYVMDLATKGESLIHTAPAIVLCDWR